MNQRFSSAWPKSVIGDISTSCAVSVLSPYLPNPKAILGVVDCSSWNSSEIPLLFLVLQSVMLKQFGQARGLGRSSRRMGGVSSSRSEGGGGDGSRRVGSVGISRREGGGGAGTRRVGVGSRRKGGGGRGVGSVVFAASLRSYSSIVWRLFHFLVG